MSERHDRDSVYINGRAVLHSTAQREWRCGECGSKLATRWFPDSPTWRTVCRGDAGHSPDGFVHQSTWDYMEARRVLDGEVAKDVLAHLPEELQTAILATS